MNHFKDGYAAIANTAGIGNNILIARLQAAATELQTLFDNLTQVQSRCSELLEEKRNLASVLRLLNDLHALECSVAEPACGNCVRCRAKALVAE
jgi:hypothetical protein